jgi:hypothetical protein
MEVKPDHAALFDRLAAAEVLVLEYTTAGREAYEAANQVLIAKTDRPMSCGRMGLPGADPGRSRTGRARDPHAAPLRCRV